MQLSELKKLLQQFDSIASDLILKADSWNERLQMRSKTICYCMSSTGWRNEIYMCVWKFVIKHTRTQFIIALWHLHHFHININIVKRTTYNLFDVYVDALLKITWSKSYWSPPPGGDGDVLLPYWPSACWNSSFIQTVAVSDTGLICLSAYTFVFFSLKSYRLFS